MSLIEMFILFSQLYDLEETLKEFIRDKKKKGEGKMFTREQYRLQIVLSFQEVLGWWRRHGHTLPRLSLLAWCILDIQASSANSQRVFSAGGLTVTDKRTRLNEGRVEDLIYLVVNLPILEIFDNSLNGGTVAKRLKLSHTGTPSKGNCCPIDDLFILLEEESSDLDKTFQYFFFIFLSFTNPII